MDVTIEFTSGKDKFSPSHGDGVAQIAALLEEVRQLRARGKS